MELLDDEPKRAQLGKLGRVRVEQELAWCHQQGAYLDVYQRLTDQRQPARAGWRLICAGWRLSPAGHRWMEGNRHHDRRNRPPWAGRCEELDPCGCPSLDLASRQWQLVARESIRIIDRCSKQRTLV